MLHFGEARQMVLDRVRPAAGRPAVERASLREAAHRVLAEAVRADRDYPPFDRATRDGYAVRAADLASVPCELTVLDEVRAGAAYEGSIGLGECVSIMTGAPVPAGADAVVMVEYTETPPRRDRGQTGTRLGGARPPVDAQVGKRPVEALPDPAGRDASDAGAAGLRVRIDRTVKAGENIVPRGSESRAGSQILPAGRRIGYAEAALLASVGRDPLAVYRRPRVAILPTGDEIVEAGRDPLPCQIRNSNSYSLAVQAEQAGGHACPLPIAPDEPVALGRLIDEGLTHDLLLLSGGVSMGKYDLVEEVLRGRGAEFFFDAVAIQPGRPLVFGYVRATTTSDRAATEASRGVCGLREGAVPGTFFFGLPGNPLSTMVTFELFARPALELLAGMEPAPLLFLGARLAAAVRHKPGLTRFLPALLSPARRPFESEVRLVEWQGSGDLASLARANCYLVVPDDREELSAGEMAGVLLRQ